MGRTFAQKVLARASGRASVAIGEVVIAEPDLFELIDLVLPNYFATLAAHGVTKLRYPERCIVFNDHEVPAQTIRVAGLKKKLRGQLDAMGIRHVYEEGRHGISHQAIVEKGHVTPGMLVVSADTHVTTVGAVGALAVPLNYETVQAIATGDTWFQVPETVRVELRGTLGPGAMSRDLAQHVIGALGPEVCDYRVIEFTGPGLAGLDMDARLTLCNVTVDAGAKAGVAEFDAVTEAWLRPRVKGPLVPVASDPDAQYAHRVVFELGAIEPLVALPPRPDHVVPVSKVAGKKIDQVYIGSCAGGRLEDLRAAAAILEGRAVHRDVRLIVVPTSQEIYASASREGLLATLADAGAVINPPSCGPCYGNLAPLVDGDVCLSTGTTNQPGRMGSAQATIYLSNAAVAAASAVAGEITDPRHLVARSAA
jgi:3-isopropylmalate/(R)-2-methylmalate dehydratase large subunit